MVADPADFWPDFGQENLVEVECTSDGSLATEVLRFYGIPYIGDEGGALDNLDILHMDAMSVIKMSLMEYSAMEDGIYEPIVNEFGEVEFKAIGTYDGQAEEDSYYEIQTGTYAEECVGVLVTGAKPRPFRKPPIWTPIWREAERKEVQNIGTIMEDNCQKSNFSRYCNIIFPDPQLESGYEDGIDNLYDIGKEEGNEYDNIMGYAYYIDFPNSKDTPEATVDMKDTAKLLIKVGGEEQGGTLDIPFVGNLQKRPTLPENFFADPQCYAGNVNAPDFTDGVEIVLPDSLKYQGFRETTIDKFIRVVNVYLVGLTAYFYQSKPINDAAALVPDVNQDDIEIEIEMNDTISSTYKLEEGTHFVIAYDDEDPLDVKPYIVFSDNSHSKDPKIYGSNQDINVTSGDYVRTHGVSRFTGTIIPINQTMAFIAKQIIAEVEIRSPSIEIFHPDGENNMAYKIARDLDYLVSPMIVVQEPPPIAFNGSIVDVTDAIVDHDPTDSQDLTETNMDRILDIMDGGSGLTLTMSFLDGNGDPDLAKQQVEKLSLALYEYMNSGDGVASTYVCGPNAEPQLGGFGPDDATVVNSINYSYTDSNSYTISVTTGPKLVGGFTSVTGDVNYKQAENVSMRGTITEDMGNHIHYKVRIDGYGERIALNTIPEILRVGDVVNCSINNNPVEL